MMEELQQLESAHPELVTPDSPTQRVGGAPEKASKRVNIPRDDESGQHLFGSRTRRFRPPVRELPAATALIRREHKFDGLSIRWCTKRECSRGVTRGDGTTGEDVTANVRSIRSIPLSRRCGRAEETAPAPGLRSARRIIMPRRAFSRS